MQAGDRRNPLELAQASGVGGVVNTGLSANHCFLNHALLRRQRCARAHVMRKTVACPSRPSRNPAKAVSSASPFVAISSRAALTYHPTEICWTLPVLTYPTKATYAHVAPKLPTHK